MSIEQQNTQPKKSQPINFGAMWAALKKHRKLYYKVLPVAFVVACVITLSLPNYYKCEVALAPEMGGGNSSVDLGTLASVASSFGVNIGGSTTNKLGDAITPTLYPDLMNSVDFKTALFGVRVQRKTDKAPMTYFHYLMKEQKKPWWFFIVRFFKPEPDDKGVVNPFELTKEQEKIAKKIERNVTCKVDKKTSVIKIEVTDQDPRIAATMADSVKNRLQDFLTHYRTKKARHDLEFAEVLQRQAKKDYERVRRLYVDFMDANNDITLMSARQKQMDLENEMQLLYNNYTATSAQVIAAKAKVQEVTPAFTTLQSATVPLRKAGPARSKIVLICLFLSFLVTTIFVLNKENQLKILLGLS